MTTYYTTVSFFNLNWSSTDFGDALGAGGFSLACAVFGLAHHRCERLIGDATINQVPLNTMFYAKCLIGCKFDDAKVQSDIKHFPFTVFSKCGKPYIRDLPSIPQEFNHILDPPPFNNTVVTAPPLLSSIPGTKQQVTNDAGILRFINEPTTVAIAFNSLH